MNTATSPYDEDRVGTAIAEFLEAHQSGTPVDPAAITLEWPGVSEALKR